MLGGRERDRIGGLGKYKSSVRVSEAWMMGEGSDGWTNRFEQKN